MLKKIELNQKSPVNHFELSIIEDKKSNRFILVENPVIDTAFNMITTVNYIQSESIQGLYKMNDVGRCIRAYDPALGQYLNHHYAIKELVMSNYESEHCRVFIKAFQKVVSPFINDHDIHLFWNAQVNRPFEVYDEDTGELKSSKTTAQLKNSLVHEISELVNSSDFKKVQYVRAEKSKNQYERATKLTQKLRNVFSKLLVLRIDFCWKTLPEEDLSFDEFKAYFTQLLKRFHYDKNLPNIVGYLWKLEFGQQKGYHYHCIFYMDGNKFQNDAYYSEKIGQFWNNLTQDKGYYHNCHRSKVKYRNLAIGMAHHEDQVFFDNLDQVLLYICKQDQFLIDKRLIERETRVFQTSKLPNKQKTIGRPRKFKQEPDLLPHCIEPPKLVVRKQMKPFMQLSIAK